VNIVVVRNAIGALEKLLSEVRNALWQVEREVFGDPGYGDEGGTYENPRGAMGVLLGELHDILLVVLEAAEMPEARESLNKAWVGFTSTTEGLGHTNDDDDFQNCESPALTFLERIVQGLRMTVSDEISSEEA
jgi:hypothetical protein